jgi:hypothetical protein
MGDLLALPFRQDFAELVLCLGVLHTLPTDALKVIPSLGRYAPDLLVYLYYALDNRPAYFRWLLSVVTAIRNAACRVRAGWFRSWFTWAVATLVYRPCVVLGTLLQPLDLARYVPLYEVYRGKSLTRIRQDVYDRFFTGIEQRYSRQEIRMLLQHTFREVTISEGWPYWHFLCVR